VKEIHSPLANKVTAFEKFKNYITETK